MQRNNASDFLCQIAQNKLEITSPYIFIRAIAPSPAGLAMAGPVFAAGTKVLNIEDMHFRHTFKLGGGYWPKVRQCSKSRVVLLQYCRT